MEQKYNYMGFPRMFKSIVGKSGSNITAKVTQVLNQALPWIVILAAAAFASLGMSFSHGRQIDELSRRLSEDKITYEARLTEQRERMEWKLEELKKATDAKERETRMLEYYVIQTDGKLVKRGVLKQSDTWSARQESRK